MSTLFDVGAPVGLADPETVRSLTDEFGYDPAKVRKWTESKAATVLARRRREAHRDVNHGLAQAAQVDPSPDPSPRDLAGRLEALRYLQEALADGAPDELLMALAHSVHALTREEMLGLVPLLVLQLRVHPVTGEPILPPARGVEACA